MEDVINDVYTVCHCNEVTYGEIIKAIKEGACDIESIMDKTDAGTACGLCKSVQDDPAGERAIHLDEILEKAKMDNLCPENS